MHPAPSIIAFTTLSGIGFGMLFWIGAGLGPDAALFGWIACVLAGAFSVVGLASSALHLKHPERAWRAFSQWRSSWLSREGCLAVATMAVFGLHGAIWLLLGTRSSALGGLMAVLALITVYSTAMIYTQLKTVPRWNTSFTPVVFLMFSLAGGSLAVMFVMALTGDLPPGLALGSALLLIIAGFAKWMWLRHALKTGRGGNGSSPETATGLGYLGHVRLLEAPHTSPNYLMREMVFEVGRKHADNLWRLALVLGVVAPVALLLLAAALGGGWPLLLLATVSHIAGVLAVRWLFFAEAEHVVALYYGHR